MPNRFWNVTLLQVAYKNAIAVGFHSV